MGLSAVVANLLSLGAKLIPAVSASVHQNHQIEIELEKLMAMLERIKATMYDAEQREIRDMTVKLWLKELKGVAYDAEDVLDEYHYEILRAQVYARDVYKPDSRKRKSIQVPCGMLHQIQQISSKFTEIEKHRIALRLLEEDGPRSSNTESQIAPTTTSCFVDELGIFGREHEKVYLIDLLSFEPPDNAAVSVVTIVGPGGLGKTTLAQLAYNDQRIRQRFDKFGWICVSGNFNLERLTKESVESITGNECGLTNLSALQMKISKVIKGRKVFLVIDDAWNEKRSLWDSFLAPFKTASFVKILITTRYEHVAKIMQTMPTLYLRYLSEKQCWQMFKHYAFGGMELTENSKLLEIGKQIVRKCGMLPLAVKSIACLLRYEAKEESWREILKSELWESDANNEIFPSLQLSYARLPPYLKPCLVFCSMFPKNYSYKVKKLVALWISQGYIESNGNKNAEEIGLEYVKQLWQRSFFESRVEWNNSWDKFKLHDMIHDLAWLNSENGCCSIKFGMIIKVPVFSNELKHLHITGFMKPLETRLLRKFTTLRTLIVRDSGVKKLMRTCDLSIAQKLRALEIERCRNLEIELFSSLCRLKHLRYLSLGHLPFESLPDCICSLYNLQNLKLVNCFFVKLPPSIGNLVSLENLEIKHCVLLKGLPKSLCQLKNLRKLTIFCCNELEEFPSDMGEGNLTNLQTLEIHTYGVSSLPSSLGKITGIQTLRVRLMCETIGWLKYFVDICETLCLHGLKNISNLTDVQCTNLVGMHNLKRLQLCWNELEVQRDGIGFWLLIKSGQNVFDEVQIDHETTMTSLHPHPNIKELEIDGYSGIVLPEWIGNPSSCASLERITIYDCKNLNFLPFGSLYKLKYLSILSCDSLQILRSDSLPLHLEELHITGCRELKTITSESLREHSMGSRKFTSLRSLVIGNCPKLHQLAAGLFPVDFCKVEVRQCPLIRDWCLLCGMRYKTGITTPLAHHFSILMQRSVELDHSGTTGISTLPPANDTDSDPDQME